MTTTKPNNPSCHPGPLRRALGPVSRQLLLLGPLVIFTTFPLVGAIAAEDAVQGNSIDQGTSEEALNLHETLTRLHARQEQMEQEIARLERVNKDAEAARKMLTVENAEFAASLAQERARADNTQTLLDTAESTNVRLQSEMDDLQTALHQAQSKVSDLEGTQQTFLSQRDALQARLDESQKRLAELENQITTQHTNHTKAMAEAAAAQSALEAEHGELRGAHEAAEAKLAQLEGRLMTREKEHAAAAAAAAATETKIRSEKGDLESKLADLAQRHKILDETHSGAVAAVERLQKDKSTLQTNLELEQQKSADLQSSLADATTQVDELKQQAEAAAAAAGEMQDRLMAEKQVMADEIEQVKQTGADERQSMQERLDAKESEVGNLEGRLAELEATLGRTESDLAAVRDRLPATAGGTVTNEQVQKQAAEHMLALRQLHKERGTMGKEAWQEAREQLEQSIRDQQFMLAQSLSAQSVYRVQRDDTLAKISMEVYGKAGRWPDIYEANRHLLEDPDRLFPGMSLVIP